MDTEEINYTRTEYKRSFLVSPLSNWNRAVEPYSKNHEDKYLCNTRLRLRVQTDSDSGRQLIKLNKKSDSNSPYFRTINRILLSPIEYGLLEAIEGNQLSKTRYYHHYLGEVFSIDVYARELEGLILCKTESEDLEGLLKIEFPEYAIQEVTEDPFFTGGNLCRTTRAELAVKLSHFNLLS
jgi:CYTH domain-containing protein